MKRNETASLLYGTCIWPRNPVVKPLRYSRVSEVTDRKSVLYQKRPKVALLKKLLCDAGIISALDHLSGDSKPDSKLATKR